jgi:chitin-binding protein
MIRPHLLALGLLAAGSPLAAFAHGYVSKPESRSYLCRLDQNSGCGAIQYEPQSLEYRSGFPATGPADGQIASANQPQFAPLDEQTSTRWTKRVIAAGPQTFIWTFTAPHSTRNWRYYLTRADWNPNQKLSRAAFDTTPFCTVNGNNVRPPATVTHTCTVPARTGYQIVLAVWEVADTVNSFHNVIDVQFPGGGPLTTPTWNIKGTIFPSVDLSPGDRVSTRVFNASGEQTALSSLVSITTVQDGQRNTWPYLLAGRINATQTLLRAGQKGANGSIEPAYGQNDVHARSDSNLQRIEIQIDKAAPSSLDLLLTGPAAVQTLNASGQLSLSFGVTAVGELDVEATVFDSLGIAKGSATASLNSNGTTLAVAVRNTSPGAHQLVVKAVPRQGGTVIQKVVALDLRSTLAYQYAFPTGMSSYVAGTRVLQPANGKVYECKPFPYSGWCKTWSPSANQYEPGVGSAWTSAWIER